MKTNMIIKIPISWWRWSIWDFCTFYPWLLESEERWYPPSPFPLFPPSTPFLVQLHRKKNTWWGDNHKRKTFSHSQHPIDCSSRLYLLRLKSDRHANHNFDHWSPPLFCLSPFVLTPLSAFVKTSHGLSTNFAISIKWKLVKSEDCAQWVGGNA